MMLGRKEVITVISALIICAFLGGCGAMKFIATGDEFRKICEDNGIAVADVRDQASSLGEVDEKSLLDAYAVTDPDGTYTVYYLRFSDRKASEAFYSDVAGRMDGEEVKEANYAAKSETVGGLSRKICQEDGRVLYAEGDTHSINSLIAQVTSGFETGADEEEISPGSATEDAVSEDVSGNSAVPEDQPDESGETEVSGE